MDKREAYLEIKRNTLREHLLKHFRLNASADKYFFDLSMELYGFHDQANHYRQATDADTSGGYLCNLLSHRKDEETCLDFLIKNCLIATDDTSDIRIVALATINPTLASWNFSNTDESIINFI